MQKSLIEKQPDGTIKLTISIPFDLISKAREKAIIEVSKQANVPGFRKGKAPEKLVEEKLNKEQIDQDVLKDLLPGEYQKAIAEHQLRPIMNPKIHIEKMDEGKDWTFEALTCEAPAVEAGDYKKSVQKVTAKSKIILPGKEPQKPTFEEIAKAILETSKVNVPAILLEQETDRLLSQLLNDIKKLGLNLEQYLASTNRTPEDLRAEYSKRAEDDMKLEFVLQKIAENEKITVEEKEIEEAIQKAKSDEERKHLEGNKYLLAAILRQQKTLDFLMGL
ncbi:MAG TPA: trigger factor [Candidatus Saccharimonadales bacterium]|nr:trigger factor [Candidatus Saccharimonadales bacterium]